MLSRRGFVLSGIALGGEASSDKSVIEAVNPPIYPLRNLRVGFVPAAPHMPAGFWRSVAHSWTTFFIESFIDELATAANVEPLEFRRRALAYRPRHLQVLNRLKEELGENPGAGPWYRLCKRRITRNSCCPCRRSQYERRDSCEGDPRDLRRRLRPCRASG